MPEKDSRSRHSDALADTSACVERSPGLQVYVSVPPPCRVRVEHRPWPRLDPPGLQITIIMFFSNFWSSPEETKPERVPLPLQALDRCSTCESQRKLRLCANCGEVRDPEIILGKHMLTTALSDFTARTDVKEKIGQHTRRSAVSGIAIGRRTTLTLRLFGSRGDG